MKCVVKFTSTKKVTNYHTGILPTNDVLWGHFEKYISNISYAEFCVQTVCVCLPKVLLSREKMTRWFFSAFLCLHKLHLLAGNQFNFDKLTSYFKTDAVLAVMKCSSGMGVITKIIRGGGVQRASEWVTTIKSNLARCPDWFLIQAPWDTEVCGLHMAS